MERKSKNQARAVLHHKPSLSTSCVLGFLTSSLGPPATRPACNSSLPVLNLQLPGAKISEVFVLNTLVKEVSSWASIATSHSNIHLWGLRSFQKSKIIFCHQKQTAWIVLLQIFLKWGTCIKTKMIECHKWKAHSVFHFLDISFKKWTPIALAAVPQWIECRPANQRVAGLISSLGHMPGFQARSQVVGAWEAATHWCFFPPLSPSLPLSKINK